MVETLLRLHPRLKALFISGHPNEALELPATVPLLAKPFTPALLLMKVRETLDG